jgi:hypothetical protein
MRFEVVGSSLKLFYRNTLVSLASDGVLQSGSVGVWGTRGVRFDNFTANRIVFTPVTLPHVDDFSGANGSLLNSSWYGHLGAFAIQDNSLLGLRQNNIATLYGLQESNSTAEAVVDLIPNGSYVALLSRYNVVNGNHFWGGLYNRDGTYVAEIWRLVAGSWTMLSRQTAGTSLGTLRMETVGQSVKLFLNNKLWASRRIPSLPAARWACRSSRARCWRTTGRRGSLSTRRRCPLWMNSPRRTAGS